MVIQSGITETESIKKAKSLLKRVNAKLLGSVFNYKKVEKRPSSTYYYPYRGS